jgi:quercetin dioxygenase-like cupin family protein
MRNEQAAPETKGVTVKLLAALDLGPEIEGMAGRQLRMRMVTIEPGGVFGPIHDHKDRPGIVYILQGTITDHRNGGAKEYGPGVSEVYRRRPEASSCAPTSRLRLGKRQSVA